MKKALIVFFAVILLAGLGLAAYYLATNHVLFNPRASSPSGTAVIGLTPATQNVGNNSNFTITMTLDTKGVGISGLQAVLNYPSDTADFQLVSIDLDGAIASAGWSKRFGSQGVNGTNEQIQFAAVYNGSWTSNGQVNFATLTFKSTTDTSKTLTYDPALTKATSGVNAQDVLLTPSDTAAVTVGSGGSNVTPTPTSTPSVTASPTDYLTPTPTPTSGSATLTPTTSTQSNGGGVGGGGSAVPTLSTFSDGANLTSFPNNLTGTGAPGSTINISVYSGVVIAGTTTVNSSGDWSWSPSSTTLAEGAHSIVLADSLGSTTTVNFTINSSLPATGNSSPLLVGFSVGLLFLLISGALVAL